MIDLHIHTNNSDGSLSTKEVLIKANKNNLDVISLTDHDNCNAYLELDNININELYKGKIIVGCEFTTSFKNQLIEVLGYGFDYKKIISYLKKYYNNNFLLESKKIIYNRLLNKIKKYNLVCDLNYFLEKDYSYYRELCENLIKYKKNKEILNENIFTTYSDILRKGIYNPNSKLFLNHIEFKIPLKNVIDLIHESSGYAFLAHPYVYQINDLETFLKELYEEFDLDGIECFYSTFTNEESYYLVNFAKNNNLLTSGGSDYHGPARKNFELGIGSGNLNIKNDILNNWNIDYYKN